ncbi:hypothetical protein Pfo_030243, partial [Paulownia fortunei]
LPCKYNFGDSNSDTGGIAAAFYPQPSPFGETFFYTPAGRASDGRLIIDFIGSNYQQGANFATGGATILQPNESWFQAKEECFKKRLPKPEDFSKALFTLDIGQNDIVLGLRDSTFELLMAGITNIVSQFIVQNLYQRGARTFWIHNMGPIGCSPVAPFKVQDPVPGNLDDHGCVKSHNYIALEFNKQLKDRIVKLRSELSEAAIIYVDMYRAKYELITNSKSQGFEDPFKICCGYHGIGYDVWCGKKAKVNGSEVFAGSCANPSKVISWDGVHYSEAANRWIANRLVNGSLSDPPIAVTRACHKQMWIL